MTSTAERDIADRLADLAETAPVPHGDLYRQVRRTARRQRRRRAGASAAGVALLAVAAVVGLPAVLPHGQVDRLSSGAGTPTTVAPYLAWPARGPFAGRAGLAGAATAAWDQGTGQPHTGVRILFAGAVDGAKLVLIEGRAPSGTLRLAALSTQASSRGQFGEQVSGGPLYLRLDRPAPPPTTPVVAFTSSHLGTAKGQPTPGGSAVTFALAGPHTSDLEITSSLVDSNMVEGPVGRRGIQFAWTALWRQATASTITVTVWTNGQRSYTGHPSVAGIGDPR